MPGPEVTMEGINDAEMRQVVVLGQLILGLSAGQPAGRLFNACMWLQAILADNNPVEFVEGCATALHSLAERLDARVASEGQAAVLDAMPPPGGTTLH